MNVSWIQQDCTPDTWDERQGAATVA